MILTDYYRAVQIAKSQTRFDVDLSTESYLRYEIFLKNQIGFNKGGLSFHFSKVPDNFKLRAKDKPDMAITRTENISSVFVPNPKLSVAYGDNKETNDCILILDKKGENGFVHEIEIFVARGQKHNSLNLYRMLVDGDLDNEMEALRQKAVTKTLPKP
jgi:hypothetical protein